VGKVIDVLLHDHKNIFSLLALLEKQVKHFVAGEFANYQILTDIMHYFVNQPDIYHHPHEDIIFAALKQKNINVADLIDEITTEHQSMAAASATIYDELIQIQGNAIFPRDEIVLRLTDFISRYHAHIAKEEEGLFALAKTTLDDADWGKIDAEINHNDDPLFGKILDGEYKELYKAILAEDTDSLRSEPTAGI